MYTRSQEFDTGVKGTGQVSSSLSKESARFNSLVPVGYLGSKFGGTYNPNSVISQYMKDPRNGNSATDAQRQTPSGELPSVNDGFSKSTYEAMNPSFGLGLKI